MKFNILKNNKNTANLNSDINERTREKFILKRWIESSRKTTCTDSYTRRENRCQIPFKTSLTPSKMDFSAGRSMVEMLGVLAIIGVLSIGGISGYTIAMRKYQAEEILSYMHKYATILYTRNQALQLNGTSLTPTEISDNSDSEDSSYNQDVLDNNLIDYKQLGLNAPPKGIELIQAVDQWNIITTNSGDIVRFYVDIETKDLCESILNMQGIIPKDWAGRTKSDPDYQGLGACEQSNVSSAYAVLIYFIMN